MFKFLLLFIFAFQLNVHAQSLIKISGQVSNKAGENIEGVLIKIKNTTISTKTNKNGFYTLSFSLDKDSQITFSEIGYDDYTFDIPINSAKQFTLNITLKKALTELDQVTVTQNNSREEGMISVDAKNFSSSPNASQSLESLLKQLPGVSTNNELSSQYSVRGGNFDENLIYINDIEIFKPYLVRNGQQEGLSLLNPDMAGEVQFSAGGFSAKYGDKMSSVLDVHYKVKDTTNAIVSLGTNSLSATTFIAHKNFNLVLGFRNKSNQSLLANQQTKGSYQPQFFDYQGILNYKFSSKISASVLGIVNKSKFGLVPESRETTFGTLQQLLRLSVDYEGQERDEYQNLVGAFTLNYNPGGQTFIKWINSAFSINEKENFDIYGQYIFDEVEPDFSGGDFGNVKANRGIGAYQDFGRNELKARVLASEIKANFETGKSFWETGFKFQQDKIEDQLSEFNYLDSAGYSIPNNNPDFVLTGYRSAANKLTTNRISAYAVHHHDFGKFNLSSGLRFNYNSFTKEFIPSPRFILSYHPEKGKDIIYRFASGLYVQTPFYREIRAYDGKLNIAAKSQKSLHFIASSDYKFKGLGTDLKFSTELYYKHLYDLIPYDLENLRIRYRANETAKGYAAGLDFSISGEFVPDLESSFRLSLMKTQEDIAGDNEGFVKRPTDQRVNFSAFFQDKLFNSPTYKVHMNLLFGSALPTWPSRTKIRSNNFTIPAYKRLDIGFSKDLLDPQSVKKIRILDKYLKSFIIYAEIFNLLNINNTVSYLWITDVNNNRYAIPNYLTSRQLNFKIITKF